MSTYQWFFLTCMLFSAFDTAANSRKIIEYGYDNSGDINIVNTTVSQQPPQITGLTPAIVRIGQQYKLIANGTGLHRVSIDTDSANLIVSDASSDGLQVSFTLDISDQTKAGEHTLTFSTPLGLSKQTITVFPALPEITLNPAPIVLEAQGLAIELDIQLSQKDIIAHTFNLTVDNPGVAALQASSITIPVGQTRPETAIQITGLQKGVSTLTISSQSFDDFSTRIFVTENYSPAIGGHTAYAKPLGINYQKTVSPPPLPILGPFSAQLEILKSESEIVGETTIKPLLSQALILAKGAVIYNISHTALIANEGLTEVTIQGVGLANIDDVIISPEQGISISSLVAETDGSRVTFSVAVDPDVILGSRKIVLTQQGKEILTTDLRAAQITIAESLPEIETISPILVTRLSSHQLTIRGKHFNSAHKLSISPADGISIASPITVNSKGTIITANIVIDELAILGDRIVRVETDAGSTSHILSPTNTLSVINGPSKDIRFLTAPSLGIIKNQDTTNNTFNTKLYDNLLGVVHGKHIGSLSPAAQAIGADFSLTITGSGLSDVSSVEFIPDDNIAVGIPIVAEDGLSLTVPVAIDAEAEKTLRQVVVETMDGRIIASPATADRFQVTDLQPIISSLSPNFLLAGDDVVTLKIRGLMLENISSVFAIPGDDMIIGNPQVNANGTEATVSIKATAAAQTNTRVIVVETAGGESSDIPVSANSLKIVSSRPTVFDALVSPLLGIEKNTINPPVATKKVLITSSLLQIIRETTPPIGTSNQTQYADHLGILQGIAATKTSPNLASIGSSVILTIDGIGLDQVTDISLNPADGLLLTNDFNINSDGTQLTIPLDIAIDAELSKREIILTTATGKLPFVNSNENRLQITGLQPVIQSIEPIQKFPGSSSTLIVRGFNLNDTVSIEASPADGDINFGSITVNTAGTILQVPMVISASASPGPKVITVTTLAGVTEQQATSANTFTVLPLQ